MPGRPSFTVAYDLWLASWEAALSALATAIRSRALSTNEAAAHGAVISAERELVTKQLALLLGRELPRHRTSDDASIPSTEEPFPAASSSRSE
jgi:hypothetical protein